MKGPTNGPSPHRGQHPARQGLPSVPGWRRPHRPRREAAEWWAGAASFTDAHAATAPFSAAIEEVDAHHQGAVGWAAVRALVRWDDAETPVRLTLVLIREDRGWQIVQSHVSTPAA